MRIRAFDLVSNMVSSFALAPSCALILLLLPSPALSLTNGFSKRHRTLRTVSEVFNLSEEEAAKGYPVELDAVVLFSDPEWGGLFVQDRTGATYIDVHGTSTRYPQGARIRVQAVTAMVNFERTFLQPKITVIGHGTLPRPEQKSIAELDAGAAESHLVVTEGVMHPCNRDWGRVCFCIHDAKKEVWIFLPQPESPDTQSLVGATVRVVGVAARYIDGTNKRAGAQLYVNKLEAIKVETPPLQGGFSSSPAPIQKLAVTDLDQRFVGQMHLRGTVTWHTPGLLCIKDSSGTALVAFQKDLPVRTGSVVDAIGFPSRWKYGLELSDSEVRMTDVQTNAAAIAPLQLTAAEAIKRALNGQRVHLHGRLISQNSSNTEIVYQMEDAAQQFNAVLLRSDTAREIVGLTRNSILDLDGIALIQNGGKERRSLIILIASPADIVVLGGSGWLTPWHGLAILLLAGCCVMIPIIWIERLRQTALRQEAILRARQESEARLENRFRQLFERNLAAVFTWRPDGAILDCNMAFVKLLGFSAREELIGRIYWDFKADSDQPGRLETSLLEEELNNCDVSLKRRDGSTVHLITNITPVNGPDGVAYQTIAIDVTQLRQNQAELQRAKDAVVFESLNDRLTGLPNRRFLLETLSSLLLEVNKEAGKIALLYLDLDGFRAVNDNFGKDVGDTLLTQVSARLLPRIRQGDTMARVGGDEFMVIMRSPLGRKAAVQLAEELREAIAQPFQLKGNHLSISASVGISIFPEDASDVEGLMQQADHAMQAGKRAGKNRITYLSRGIASQTHDRLNLARLLREAIARQEIYLVRFEALARWTHPVLGQIPPDKFIPIAEESGIIETLDAYVMELACTEAVGWQKRFSYPVQLAVNASSFQFSRDGFVKEVSAALDRTGLHPELLQIEITETAMMGGIKKAAETILRFRKMGISMAIDDFGTGYSNLSYLPSLAFDVLKVDRSFVFNLEMQPEAESMLSTVIMLAHNLGMQVIVEGVETPEQLRIVKALGADVVQGFLLGRPTSNPVDVLRRHARRTNDRMQKSAIAV